MIEPTDAAMLELAHEVDALEMESSEQALFEYTKRALAKWGTPAPVAEPANADSVLEDALSDAVRVPLDSLHADAAYLIGRLRDGSMPYARVIEIIRERIDAAKAAIRARAVLAKWGQSAQAAGNVPAIADLPPLPDIDLRDVGTKPQDVKDFLNGYATEYARIALAARAPAGSVLEDAARLDWLESTKQRGHYCGVFSGKLLTRESIDAARKQGGV